MTTNDELILSTLTEIQKSCDLIAKIIKKKTKPKPIDPDIADLLLPSYDRQVVIKRSEIQQKTIPAPSPESIKDIESLTDRASAPPNAPKNYITKLQVEREKQGLTQNDLGVLAGISGATISRIERIGIDGHQPLISHLIKLGNAFGFSVDYAMTLHHPANDVKTIHPKSTKSAPPGYATVKQAAKMLNIGVSTIRYRIIAGDIEAKMYFGRYVIKKEGIKKYMQNQINKGPKQ